MPSVSACSENRKSIRLNSSHVATTPPRDGQARHCMTGRQQEKHVRLLHLQGRGSIQQKISIRFVEVAIKLPHNKCLVCEHQYLRPDDLLQKLETQRRDLALSR